MDTTHVVAERSPTDEEYKKTLEDLVNKNL